MYSFSLFPAFFCCFLFLIFSSFRFFFFFFFNDTATTEIYTLSLHDALPIFSHQRPLTLTDGWFFLWCLFRCSDGDRKSTRLNSSHDQISYAVFCLKKKKKKSRSYLIEHPII